MWEGLPQVDAAPYAVAKKLALIQSAAYRQQYGFKSIVVVPGNMYGAYDNFDPDDSHVVPAIIRKVYEAHLAKAPEVVMWGSGRAVRDFVYAGDVARLFPYFIEEYDSIEPVNLSSGTPCTIGELGETVCEIVGYRGRIVWDTTKPEGQMMKVFDVSRMKTLGLKCDTSLREGLQQTLRWLEGNYAAGAVRL